jgi:lysophospholipase L1-like esterase
MGAARQSGAPRRRGPRRSRIAFYSATGLLIVLAFLICRLFFWLPTGSGPAGPPVPAAPFERVWHEGPVVLLGLGDSITAGYGARPGYSYFDRLAATPPEDAADTAGKCLRTVCPRLEADNRAVSGSTSLYHAQTQIAGLDAWPDDVLGIVVMTTGGNDIIHNYGRSTPREGAMYGATLEQARPWIANYARRLDEMMAEVRVLFPGGCHVFLASIYDPTDGTGSTGFTGLPDWPDALAVLSAYNEAIARCAERHEFVHLVDIHGPFLGHGLHCRKFWLPHHRPDDPHYWYAPIVEDPNERGYDAIRRLFLLRMVDVLAPGD